MARSFSNAKTVSTFVTDKITALVSRRGYGASASQGGVSSGARGRAPNVMLKKVTEEPVKNSWVTDTITGYYRPESHAQEIDAAELPAMLLKNFVGRQ